MVQRVEPGHEGVHFDIETDNVEAELARLEKLGAKRVRQVKNWWVMEDPGGHRFCIVPGPSTHWPEGAVECPAVHGARAITSTRSASPMVCWTIRAASSTEIESSL